MLSFHRHKFQQVLLDRLLTTSCQSHNSKRIVSYCYEQPISQSRRRSHPPIVLRFQDGTLAHCDLLIGADGIQSTVRACMLREAAEKSRANGRTREAKELLSGVESRWSGMSIYRTTVSAEALNRKLSRHRVLSEPVVVSVFYVTPYDAYSSHFHHAVYWNEFCEESQLCRFLPYRSSLIRKSF